MHLLIRANSLRIPLADQSVQCCVTSPPYWGLRDYGVEGQLGLEATPEAFVATMVCVFREVRRVLRDDGVCFMNLGDSYNGSGPSGGNGKQYSNIGSQATTVKNVEGLKPKDLCGIPWRVALALQADGWYLRSDIIWSKPNPMPESVTDRPTKSHEYIFLLTKSERYFWDAEAVKSPAAHAGQVVSLGDKSMSRGQANGAGVKASGNGLADSYVVASGRNIRSVWSIPTESYSGAHFATYPRKLVEPCIKAGTSEKGCCPECGKCWVRVVESERVQTRPGLNTKIQSAKNAYRIENGMNSDKSALASFVGNRDPGRHIAIKSTTGWAPGCDHGREPVPCVVLDPFNGSGTTGVVAEALGRSYVGLDLSAEYLGMAKQRIERPHKPIPRPGRVEHMPLFEGIQ